MDLLLTVQRLAEMRAATTTPHALSSPPPHLPPSTQRRAHRRRGGPHPTRKPPSTRSTPRPLAPLNLAHNAKVNPHAACGATWTRLHTRQSKVRGRVLGAAARRRAWDPPSADVWVEKSDSEEGRRRGGRERAGAEG
ncbi:hypothetical protein MY10362_002710 [Beauveria mimosiformis]